MKRDGLELWVGAFAVVGILILAYFTTKIGSASLGDAYGQRVVAAFTQAPGVEPRTPVKLAGVKIGEVQSIDINGDNKAEVILRIRPEIRLPADSRIEVKTQGLIGETFVDIRAGSSSETIGDGGQFSNVGEPADIDALLASLAGVGDDVKAITASLRTVIAREETEADLIQTIENIEGITFGLKQLVDASADRIDVILQNVEGLSGDSRDLVSENRQSLGEIIENFRAISARLDGLMAANEGNLGETMTSVRDATVKLDRTLASAESIVAKIDDGQGTLGRLVNDDTLTRKMEEALDGVGDLLSAPRRLRTTFGYRAEYFTNADEVKSQFQIRLQPRRDRYYLLGVTVNPLVRVDDVTTIEETTIEGNPPFTTDDPPFQTTTTVRRTRADDDDILFTAHIAQRISSLVLRGGVTESTGGVGADLLLLDDDLSLSADAFDFDPDEAQRDTFNLKLGLSYEPYSNLLLTTGVDDVLNEPTDFDTGRNFFIGAGFTFADDDLRNLLLQAPIPGF